LSRAAELVAALDAAGLAAEPATQHPLFSMAESRWVAPASLVRAALEAQRLEFFFESMTCIDRLGGETGGALELLYTFNRYDAPERVALRVWAPPGTSVPSLAGVYGIAAWNEREAWEFFGLEFTGHPQLTWLLLPEGTEFRPLLKSFTAPPPSEYDDSLNPNATGAHEPEHAGH
jgi:NADH:ubiquinone oxidoreductase subunit C